MPNCDHNSYLINEMHYEADANQIESNPEKENSLNEIIQARRKKKKDSLSVSLCFCFSSFLIWTWSQKRVLQILLRAETDEI